MAQLDHVQPGDLITADHWNLIVDKINALLESGQTIGIKIASLVPAGTNAEPVRVGAMLQITGQSFGFSLGQTSVTFVGTSATVVVPMNQLLVGSSDTRLLLIAPTIPGLTSAGATMALRVDNGVANDSRSVFVMPIVISLQGDIFITWRADAAPNPSPNPLQASASADFKFQLKSATNLPATFDLNADIPNATVAIPPGLVSSIEIRDESGSNLIPNKRVDLGKDEIRNVLVRIPSIPSVFAGKEFSLSLSVASGNLTNTETRSFTVGTPVPQGDPDIDLNQTGFFAFDVVSGLEELDPTKAALVGSTIKLKPGKQMILMFNVKLKKQGSYDLTIQPKTGTTLNGWAPQLANTPTPIVVANDNDNTSRLVQFTVAPSVGATATGTVVFRIKRSGAPLESTKEYNVQLL